MSIRVETRNLNNGSSFVQTYETISGADKTAEKYNTKKL